MCLWCSVITDLASQPLDVEVSDVMPVDAHFATLDVVETLQDVKELYQAMRRGFRDTLLHCDAVMAQHFSTNYKTRGSK